VLNQVSYVREAAILAALLPSTSRGRRHIDATSIGLAGCNRALRKPCGFYDESQIASPSSVSGHVPIFTLGLIGSSTQIGERSFTQPRSSARSRAGSVHRIGDSVVRRECHDVRELAPKNPLGRVAAAACENGDTGRNAELDASFHPLTGICA
jgi:hypothetical protein